MIRKVLSIGLFSLSLLVLIALPVLIFTPVGQRAQVFLRLAAPSPTPRPILTVRGTPPTVQSPVAYLLDADSGSVLVNVRGGDRLPMASTTKIMTALIAIQRGKLDDVVTVQQDAIDEVKKYNGSSAQLAVGDKLKLKDLLYGLMLPSGDDAAIAVADTVGGSVTKFVDMMNQTAKQLHLTQTHYSNPDGLPYPTPDNKPDPNHYSSAADLAQLTRDALDDPLFAQIVQHQHYVIPAGTSSHRYVWDTTNTLLSLYAGATGVKTGYTGDAGYCLVFSATSNGHRLIGVVLQGKDADQRFADAQTLLDWGFALPVLP